MTPPPMSKRPRNMDDLEQARLTNRDSEVQKKTKPEKTRLDYLSVGRLYWAGSMPVGNQGPATAQDRWNETYSI